MKQKGKHILSKSSFIRGLQCSKSLYLYKYFYSLRDKLSAETLSKFARGHHVGLLAQQLFPNGVNLKPFSPQQFATAVNSTHEHILKGVNTIYEAAFNHNEVTVFLDILHFENGSWHAYEVKSSVEVSETYIMDASLQYYVISHSGINLASFNIIYINKDYQRKDGIDIKNLFMIKDVFSEAVNNQEWIHRNVEEFKIMLGRKETPDVKVGIHCNKPYTCDFIGHCWKEIPKQKTIFSIPSFSVEDIYSFSEKGLIMLEDIEKGELNDLQKLHVETAIADKAHIQTNEIHQYFSGICYPLLFAEMLTCCPAVPLRKETKPYQNIPFLLNASLINEEGREIKALSVFQEDISNKNNNFCENILSVINQAETLLVFDRDKFISSLQTLQNMGLSEEDIIRTERKVVGMRDVFNKGFFYNPRMPVNPDLISIAKYIFKIRIPRHLISSSVIASDMYESLQSETDMFHIIEIKEKLNEYAAFSRDILQQFFIFLHTEKPV